RGVHRVRAGLVPRLERPVLVRPAAGGDPDPSLQQDAQPGSGVRVRVRDASRREVDAVAADEPIALRPLVDLPDERIAVDPRGAEVRLVAADVVDDARAVLRLHAVREAGDPQWKVWPPSMTIVCPVMKSEPGPQ